LLKLLACITKLGALLSRCNGAGVLSVDVQERAWPSTWEEAEAFAWRLVDGMGCPIDEGILHTVVTLNLLGLRTSQSCEGHLDGGLPYPWLDFQTEECPDWYEQAQEDACREGQSVEKEEAATDRLMTLVAAYHHENPLYTQLTTLLETFYKSRIQTPEEWRIIVRFLHPGYYRLMPLCGYDAKDWLETARAKNLACAQAEIQALGKWLREQWQTRNQEPFDANKLSGTF
jgi:hypothetical protein